MTLESKVSAIERMFACLEQEIAQFQSTSGLHCIAGCGKCCTKSDIDASPLEFLPWAFHVFMNDQAEAILEFLNQNANPICHLYQPLSVLDSHSGKCGDYTHRGLICRLFGYGASRDKIGQLRLATCKIIKESQQANYESTDAAIKQGLYVPIFTDYYMKLSNIDFRLGNTILPINQAMKVALEEVLAYFAYRPFPKGFKKAA